MPPWEVGYGVSFQSLKDSLCLGGCNSSLFIFKFSFVKDEGGEIFNGVNH